MMKICHVTTVDLSIRFLVLNLLLYYKERGWDVHAAASPGEYVAAIERSGIPFHNVPITRRLTPFSDLISLIRLVALFRRENFDVVHVHTPKGSFLGALAAGIARVPVRFYTIHGFYFHPDMPKAKAYFYRFFEFLTSRFVHRAFTVNREDRETAIRLGYYAPERIIFLGGGIDLGLFDQARFPASQREEIRRSLGFLPDHLVVGFIGRLVREKGLMELFEAFKRLRSRHPGARLLVVGPLDPKKKDAITPEAAKVFGISDVVVFTGMRLDIPEMISAMDVFVLPSYREGFPQSVMEASAMGVPVVTTNVRGCREAVEDGKTGIVVPVCDVVILEEAIHRLLSNPSRAKEMGGAGRLKALLEFDETKKFRIIRDAYLSHLGLSCRGVRAVPGMAVTPGSAVKRAFDCFISAAAIVLLSPMLVVLSFAVLGAMGRPVLFIQERPGRGGKIFRLYKFRTMKGAHDPGGWILPDADRLTPFGRWMRKWSLDEIPELFNVFKGEMSLVGPRPLLMQYLERHTPEQARRHEVKPGLTGWAQVNGRNAITWEEKFGLDVWYVENRSFLLDLKILAMTVWKVLQGEGISAPGDATMPEFQGTRNGEMRKRNA